MWLYVVILFLLALTASGQLDKIRVHPTDHSYRDESNRVRIFHGMNFVTKGFPWYPRELTDSRMDDVASFGYNIVRLGCMWTGAEPHEGEYNGTYIQILQDMTERMADRGIYTMMDMHQDVLSSRTGSYDGIPPWLYDSFPPPTNPYPWPYDSIDFWEQGYLTQATAEGFQYFYNNTNDALDKWADFWNFIALNFRDMPSVIGYNLMNEPWVGDQFANQELLRSAVAGRQNLMPAYEVVNPRIREADPDTIVFYEPVMYGQLQLGNGSFIGSGFDDVPGGPEYVEVSSYSYHTYCWNLEFIASNATDEEREDARQFCVNTLLPQFFDSVIETITQTGGSSMLTEFGLCKTHGDVINVECVSYMDLCDEYLQSWVEWDGQGMWWDGEGNPKWQEVLPHVRAYASAIAGTPLSMSFNDTNLDFTLEYETDPQIELPTEIVVPSLRYTAGFQVDASEGLVWEVEGDIVKVFHHGAPDSQAREVEVSITANNFT